MAEVVVKTFAIIGIIALALVVLWRVGAFYYAAMLIGDLGGRRSSYVAR